MRPTPKNDREEDLLASLKRGEWEAFQLIYERFWEKLYLTAFQVLGNEEASKDAVQDLFINLWERREELNISFLGAYLRNAMKYQLANQLRKKHLQTTHLHAFEQILGHNEIEESLFEQELQQAILQTLAQLPPRCREIFQLSRFEHKTNKEIASQLNLSVSTVENQINKALHILRTNIPHQFVWLFYFFWLTQIG